MSIKEDILEQLVDDWLQARGYFTRHNLKFKPSEEADGYSRLHDSVASDIDVIGIHPLLSGWQRVQVVSCKSWQGGFSPARWISRIEEDKVVFGKAAWKSFRELAHPRWSSAFLDAVEKITGSREFTYVTAVPSLRGDPGPWERHAPFARALEGNPLQVVTLKQMAEEVAAGIGTTVASSHLGRTLQLLKAAGFKLVEGVPGAP